MTQREAKSRQAPYLEYAELKCKTNFSFLRGASHPQELVEKALELKLKGLALTDKDGVYGIPKAYHFSKNHPDFKFIVGTDLTFTDHPSITLLARDRAAYGLMCRLITASHADKPKGEAALTILEFCKFMSETASQGLFCLPDDKKERALQKPNNKDGPTNLTNLVPQYELLKEIFDDRLYLPLSRFIDGQDCARTQRALKLSQNFEIPIVATNDVHYHIQSRSHLQDTLTAIRVTKPLKDAGFHLFSNKERHLKSPIQMAKLFRDLPEALRNTVRIADQCTFSPGELRYYYPSEWIPQGYTAQSYLEELTWQGARKRYKGLLPDDVTKQLKYELNLIEELNYADYFLTIYDVVAWARSKNILCQGRGAAANSAVCYVLEVTAIDPVRMTLLFERFISKERNEPPDIDVDFEHERREEVIQYIYNKYGRHRAAMVSAVVTYRKRSALREISKALGIDVGTLSARAIAANFEALIQKAQMPHAKKIIDDLATEMKGFPRHLSIHSGGFTLSAGPITEIVPVEPARMPDRTIVQWDKYDLDYLGLLKVDILSLGMLSALKKMLTLVGKELHELEPDDKPTFEMIQRCDTVGTFQIESRAQMSMLGRLLPENFYDLVVQVAIVRPGPIQGKMVHPYLKRRQAQKRGQLPPDELLYPDPRAKPFLQKTLGVPLFQEQIMQIAIVLAGFTPGESDELRRAIGAWRSEGSIEKMGRKLMKGLRDNGMPQDFAERIFMQIQGFAQYGFPESHAASFALLAYASAYLKCHHPAEFTASLINSQPMGFYSNHMLVSDARRHDVEVLPVHPNLSEWDCTVIGDKRFRLGFRVVNGLSEDTAKILMQKRAQKPFTDLGDFLSRTRLRRDVLYHLAMGNAFECFGFDERHGLWQMLEYRMLLDKSDSKQLELFHGQPLVPGAPVPTGDPFFFASHTLEGTFEATFEPLDDFEKIKQEYESYSLYTTGHPMGLLRQRLKAIPPLTSKELKQKKSGDIVTIAGLILIKQRPGTAKGVTFVTLEDEFGFMDLILHVDVFEKYQDALLDSSFIKVKGVVQKDSQTVSLLVKSLESLSANLEIESDQYFEIIKFR